MSELDFHFDRGGLYFPKLRLWLDAHHAVGATDGVFVSHAHSDHTAPHAAVLFSPPTQKLMRSRVRGARQESVLAFGRPTRLGDISPHPAECPAQLTILPAGHILGSGMAFIEAGNSTLLYTGDFKLRQGLTSEPCEPRKADILVMETTFGRPEYVFPPSETVWPGIIRFCAEALDNDETPVLLGYSLGKAQEILMGLRGSGLPVSLAPPMMSMTQDYEGFGIAFPAYQEWEGGHIPGRVLIAPPGMSSAKLRLQLGSSRLAVLTGWALRSGATHQYRVDAAFPISDHADFPELVEFVRCVSPRKVFTLHGFAADFADDLRELGFDAQPLSERDQLRLDLPTRLQVPVSAAYRQEPVPSEFTQQKPTNREILPDHFSAFATLCEELRSIPAKADKLAKLSRFLAESPPGLRSMVVPWFIGRWSADVSSPLPRIGIAWFSRVLFAASGISAAQVAHVALLHGHLAETVADLWCRNGLASSQPASDSTEPLKVSEIAEQLAAWLANPIVGKDVAAWARTFHRASVLEVRWLARILMGELRVGLPQAGVEKAAEHSSGGGIPTTGPRAEVDLRDPIHIPAAQSSPPAPATSKPMQSCLSLDLP